MTLFKNKYRVESTRLQHWDYSSDGAYFVTICTKDRKELFGEIRNGIMGLNEMGNAAAICWQNISSHFPFVELDDWVVMPNHVHGVIIINKQNNAQTTTVTVPSVPSVETQNFASLRGERGGRNNGFDNLNANKFGPQSKNLASIMRGFKIGVTKYAKSNNIDFKWQARYYDHIIRDENELNRICEYIQNNPWKWEQDRNNPENIWM